MKKRWSGEKKHLDADKIQLKDKVKRDLRDLMDARDETGYVAYIKALKPDMSREDLVRLIEVFRQHCEER